MTQVILWLSAPIAIIAAGMYFGHTCFGILIGMILYIEIMLG